MVMDASFDAYLWRLSAAVGSHPRRRAAFTHYCRGLALPLGRKCLEELASATGAANRPARQQALHHFVNNSRWSDRDVLDRVAAPFLASLGTRERPCWLVHDHGHRRQGAKSIGVAVQRGDRYVEPFRCQVLVSLSLARREASLPLAHRLYLSKRWADDAQGRQRAGVPEHVRHLSKPGIAIRQIRAALARGVPQGPLSASSDYGRDPAFHAALDELGFDYAIDIPGDTPVVRFGIRPHRVTSPDALANRLDGRAYELVLHRDGAGRDAMSFVARLRIRTQPDGAERWLLIERPFGLAMPPLYTVLTLPASAPIEQLVALATMRERGMREHRELKASFGLADYNGRHWAGLHHHATLSTAAFAFSEFGRWTQASRPDAK